MFRVSLIITGLVLLVAGGLAIFTSFGSALLGNFIPFMTGLAIWALGMIVLALEEIVEQLKEANKINRPPSERTLPKMSERRWDKS